MKYKIEMSDSDGNKCRFKVILPFDSNAATLTDSKWNVLDEGYIKHRSGKCKSVSSDGSWFGACDLYLYRLKKGYMTSGTPVKDWGHNKNVWGITLYEFINWANCINDSGTGTILQSWCLILKPYHINWTLV